MNFPILDGSVTVIQFKLLLTAQERIAARQAAKTDAKVADMFELIDDQRTTHVSLVMPQIIGMIDHLVEINILTDERKSSILQAEIPQ